MTLADLRPHKDMRTLFEAAVAAGWTQRKPPGRGARDKIVLRSPDNQHGAVFATKGSGNPVTRTYLANVRQQLRRGGVRV